MKDSGKILAPVDFTETSTVALRTASRFALALGSDVLGLHADNFLPPVAYADIPVAWYSDNLDELKEAASGKLSAYLREHVSSDVATEARVVADTPVHAILSITRNEPIRLVVMGTHGRTGWRRALLGSITESVLHETDVPILTVRHADAEESASRETSVKRVLCPVNYSDVAREALRNAILLGDAFGAEVSVVHVVESEKNGGGLEELRDWIPLEYRDRCCYEELVIHGHAAESVIDLARKSKSDVIVIGAQHKHFVDTTVIGTTTERIVRHAGCPVLTVVRPPANGKT